ncbi:Rhs family protein [[Actinomadura] parvosata subsp. kistnae]|uniref:Laminin G domain-containing protein n=1 Tax=[Actinomadura] parvosata subsp. kistnae TaxID=1909395 RepID=A0A1V0AFH5_9ACTN|nr:hypothetical protein BKM31_52590 [Nonomuraea sp. ATCC 55076]SPL92478.1 Rhs family protein [Actinomadura parvosata subsp. kistnae]
MDGAQLDTLTPQLRLEAYGYGSTPSWEVERQYEVCEVTNTGGTGPCTISPWRDWTEPFWTVPAGKLEWGKRYKWKARARDTTNDATSQLTDMYFTTGVRQPLVSSLLATSGVDGQEFHQLPGNYTSTVTDASVAAAGAVPLSVVRSYNSLDRRAKAMFGAGWSTRFDMKIDSEGGTPESLLLTYPDGRQLRFIQHLGKSTYQSPPGMHFTLTKQSGGGWKLMDKQSSVYDFDAQGRLLKVADSRGRGQQLTYTGGKLTKVSADGGRSLTFAWTGDHVTSVSTDPVGGAPLTWTYHYDGDRLGRVCPPGQDSACTVYTYDSASRYRETVLDSRPVHYFRLGEVRTETWPEMGTVQCFPDEAQALGCQRFSSGVLTGQAGALSGTTNAAVTFQGSGRSSYFETSPVLPDLGNQVSVEAWFKTTKSGFIYWAARGGYSQGSWNPSSPGYGIPGLYVGTDGKLRGMLKVAGLDGSDTPVVSQQTVNDGQWHHAVITATSDLTSLYVDGTAAGSQPIGVEARYWVNGSVVGTGAAASSLPGTPAGISQPTEFGFEGSIDEVAFYGRALTATEVRAHYEARAEAAFSLSKVTLPSGRIWASNTYDPASGRLSTHTDSDGGTWKVGVPVLDSSRWVSTATVTDPSQNNLKFEYDPWRGYRQIAAIDQAEKKTSFKYDTGGFLSEITDPNNNTVTWANDERGNTVSTTTCRSSASCQTVHTEYYPRSADEFDPRNDRVVKVRDARSSTAYDNTYATTFEYNQYGEQVKKTTPATPDFPSGRSTTAAYTDGSEPAVGGGTVPAGLIKTRTDAKGNATKLRYTASGDLAEQTDPSGLVTQFEHDELGRVVAQTQISQAQPGGVKTTFTYDNLGRLATQTAPGVKNEITGVTHTAQTSYTYDPDGHRLTETVKDLTGGDPARTTTYTYDAHGREETVTDPEGGVVRTAWDNRGRQTTVTDQLGSVFGYIYTKRGELEKRTLKNWTGSPVSPQPATEITLESYSYDPAGRLAAQVDAMLRKTSYTYFGDNLLSRVIGDDVKVNGTTTTKDVVLEQNAYDPAGNLLRQDNGGTLNADGTVSNIITTTAYTYDAAGRLTSATLDPAKLNRRTVFDYDANDQTIKETYTGAAGGTRAESVSYGYNAAGVLTRQTVENGDEDLTTTWTVDDRGLATAVTDPRGNAAGATAADYTTTNTYDALGRLIEIKAPSVTIEKAGSAQQGRPTTRIGYNSAGWQTHVIDPEGRLSTAGFDKMGRRTSLTAMPYTPPGGTPVTPKIGFAYDAAGRLTKVTDPRGQITTTEYDALGNPVRVTDPPAAAGQPAGQWISEYDLAGEQLAAVDPTGARVQATYDDLGRQITQTVIERKPTSAAYVTTLTYNDAGYLTKQVQPGNKTTDYTVNAAGEVESVTDPARETTKYSYDALGRPAKMTNPLDNAMVGEYDLAGRLISVKSLDNTGATVRTVGLGYDAAGNATRYTSGEGHVTRRSYDATDLLTELVEPVSDSKSITTSFGYDATGARTRITDGRGNATWTGYNTLGLIETLTEPATTAHPDLADRTWTHVYDVAGNETALIQPGGVRHDKQYDNLNRLTKVSGSGAGIVADDKTYTYDLADRPTAVSGNTLEYNDRSLLTKLTTPAGTSTAYAYDALGNPTQRADVTGTTTYAWDADNRLKTVTDPVSGRTNTYDYDKADRLTTITSANPANTQSYTYDALDRIKTHTLKNSSGGQLAKITYGWDKDDNLTSKVTEGLAGAGSNTYGYDHAGRLTSWTGPDGTTTSYEWDASGNRTKAGDKTYTYDERNRLLEGDGSTYTYTPRGTLATQTKNGNTRHLTFDAFDRLINDGDATYTYDAFDRMLTRQKSGGTQQRFVYAGLDNDIIAITDPAGAVQASYGRDPFGGLISVKEGAAPAAGALTDLHQDLIGTFTGTALSNTTTYNPFGEVTAQTGTKPGLGYQSEYTDPDTGNVNMHARWYQPGTGTFTSRDTWTLEPNPSARMNRHGYGQASPLNYGDPSGHKPDPLCVPGFIVAPGLGAVCDGFIGETNRDNDVCRDRFGKATSCNPDPCAEFSNQCPNRPNSKDKGSKSNKEKSNPERHNDATSTSNNAPRPPAVYRPPAAHRPTGGEPKEDPCAVMCYVPGPKRPNCGKKCMIDPAPALDPVIPIIIVIGDGDLAPFGGVDPDDGVDFVPTRERPTTDPEGGTDPTPEPSPGSESPPPGGGGPEPDCESFKNNYVDPFNRPIAGVARYCRPSDLQGGSDARKKPGPAYWPKKNPQLPGSKAYRYNRCHLIGKQLGGSGKKRENLVPCLSTVNNQTVKSRENRVREAVESANGKGVVDYRVTVFYNGRSGRPSKFRMEASLDGVPFLDDCVHNNASRTVNPGATCI